MEDVRESLLLFTRRFGLLNASCCNICCGEEISLVQSHIIYEISRQTNPSMQQVAEALGLDITTFSRQIKTLENKELVVKSPNPEDRRIYNLTLSDKGTEIQNKISNYMNNFLNQIFDQFTDLERDIVLKSINLLNQALIKTGACCK